ncbi:L-rhamnose mutarotase [Flavobacteriaceae bacterium]|jgi:L-rhamnose mutarotase|nr:L-rhamnose mutarotase [Flavobacteriaceae bacterium]MDB9966941.1 L-rhamnose mutarotase [Flavobacteriaceae bacterium]|tara:strand:- start:140 stop:469 length:330 start_codon:yes stop_codon:yes gene_type:complete
MKRFCYTLDLKNDNKLKDEYIKHHKNVWPKIIDSMKESGIIKAEIYNIGNRLFLLIDTNDKFTEENKKNLDSKNPSVQKWESLMSNYQKKIEFSKTNDKWVKMDKIFEL